MQSRPFSDTTTLRPNPVEPADRQIDRREWLAMLSAAGLTIGLRTDKIHAEDRPDAAKGAVTLDPVFPAQARDLVRSVVGASHGNIDKVRELVTKRPALARAAWDWGFGDWETALGAASHMGRGDIATLLIEHGARPNLFTFAMFGHLDTVRGAMEALPGAQRTLGPHGIALIDHARAAVRQTSNSEAHRDRAREVEKYLLTIEGASDETKGPELADNARDLYPGRYRFGKGAEQVIDVAFD